MARPLFFGPALKIKRANQLLIQLAKAEATFFQSSRPELIIETDPQTGDKLAKIVLRTDLPEEFYIFPGEIIYHLRSSLDQIAVILAKVSVKKPNVKKIYFPTGDNLKGFIASRKCKTKGIDCDLVRIICRLKPYDGRKGNKALRIIFRLANIDKHLELIPAASRGSIRGITSYNIGGALLIGGGVQSLYEGITIANLGQNGTITPKDANAQIQVAGHISFGGLPWFYGEITVGKLNELVHLMQGIVQKFSGYCRSSRGLT